MHFFYVFLHCGIVICTYVQDWTASSTCIFSMDSKHLLLFFCPFACLSYPQPLSYNSLLNNLCVYQWMCVSVRLPLRVPAGRLVLPTGDLIKSETNSFSSSSETRGLRPGRGRLSGIFTTMLPYGEQKDQLLAPRQSKGKHQSTYA